MQMIFNCANMQTRGNKANHLFTMVVGTCMLPEDTHFRSACLHPYKDTLCSTGSTGKKTLCFTWDWDKWNVVIGHDPWRAALLHVEVSSLEKSPAGRGEKGVCLCSSQDFEGVVILLSTGLVWVDDNDPEMEERC